MESLSHQPTIKKRKEARRVREELNLIDCLDASSSSAAAAGADSEERVFCCNYCNREFYSSQALGGHQNAHKRERCLTKRGLMMTAGRVNTAFTGHHHPSNFHNSWHSYGRSPFVGQPHCVPHNKDPLSSPPSSCMYGNGSRSSCRLPAAASLQGPLQPHGVGKLTNNSMQLQSPPPPASPQPGPVSTRSSSQYSLQKLDLALRL